jgi:acyl-CoA synthetase (AMP-forming)/AMP-acid ligase II
MCLSHHVVAGVRVSGTTHATKYDVADYLTQHAQDYPTKIAVIDDRVGKETQSLTYAQFNARVNRLANVMVERGAGTEVSTIVWCGQNSIGLVTMINAARKLALTAVPLNYRLSDEEAAYVVDHCDATLVYVDAEFAPLFERIRSHIPKVKDILVFDGAPLGGMVSADDLMANASEEEPPPPVSPDTAATMLYTSGTTGKPKGALRYSAIAREQYKALQQLIGYQRDDVYLTTGPLYHSGPASFMGHVQTYGGTVVVQRKFNPEDWLRLVDKYKVTATFSAPTPIRMICSLDEEVKSRFDRSSMKRMIANAAPWSMALKKMYLTDFPDDSLFEVYGSTELGVNCVLRPEDQLRKPGSCGQPAPMVEIVLFDDDGNEVTGIGPDHPGQLFVKAPAVLNTYYKQEDKFQADRLHGYQTVGDVAYRDDEGYFYICDRKKDMIISGGMNIYPAEIESILEQHPDVYEATVFGIPSEEWGETVHAVVVKRPGTSLTDDDVTAFARDHLASYKVPRSLSWMDELPKTGSGKVLKRELRAPYWSGRTSQV